MSEIRIDQVTVILGELRDDALDFASTRPEIQVDEIPDPISGNAHPDQAIVLTLNGIAASVHTRRQLIIGAPTMPRLIDGGCAVMLTAKVDTTTTREGVWARPREGGKLWSPDLVNPNARPRVDTPSFTADPSKVLEGDYLQSYWQADNTLRALVHRFKEGS